MDIKPLQSLSDAEIRVMAQHAAESGECIDSANPFTLGTHTHTVFAEAFHERAADLQPAG